MELNVHSDIFKRTPDIFVQSSWLNLPVIWCEDCKTYDYDLVNDETIAGGGNEFCWHYL